MNRFRAFIVCCLLVTFPLAAWAGVSMPCADAEMASASALADHAHHQHGQASPSAVSDASPEAAGDSPWCDDCSLMCALSLCHATAIVTAEAALLLPCNTPLSVAAADIAIAFHHSALFRPPITPV